jgi:hypothetical protein
VRIIKKAMLALGLVAAFFGVVAMPTLAQPVWQLCTKLEAKIGNFENSTCTKGKTESEYEWLELTETEEVTSSSTSFEVEDSKATGGATAIKCAGSSKGTVGEEGQDSITVLSASKCTFVKAGSCETSVEPRANAVNLPWSTRLEERENTETKKIEPRDLVRSFTTKPPGWNVECRVAGVFTVSDVCEGGASTSVANNETEGIVEAKFDEVSAQESATCSVGGSKAGFTRGTIVTKAHDGAGFKVTNPNFKVLASNRGKRLEPNEEVTFTITNRSEMKKLRPTTVFITPSFFTYNKELADKCIDMEYEPKGSCMFEATYLGVEKGTILVVVESPKEGKAPAYAVGRP